MDGVNPDRRTSGSWRDHPRVVPEKFRNGPGPSGVPTGGAGGSVRGWHLAPDRAASAHAEGRAASAGQPGKLRVQAQAGLVDGFQWRHGKLGHRRYGGLGLTEAQVAGVGTSAAGAELTALLDGFVEEDLHGSKAPLLGMTIH